MNYRFYNTLLTFIYNRYWMKYCYYSICSTHRLHNMSCNRCKCGRWIYQSTNKWFGSIFKNN